jgi:hypothetical protein
MVDKIHCSICGFVMMIQVQNKEVSYTCVNTHDAKIKDDNGLGPNLDILLEYLKRP